MYYGPSRVISLEGIPNNRQMKLKNLSHVNGYLYMLYYSRLNKEGKTEDKRALFDVNSRKVVFIDSKVINIQALRIYRVLKVEACDNGFNLFIMNTGLQTLHVETFECAFRYVEVLQDDLVAVVVNDSNVQLFKIAPDSKMQKSSIVSHNDVVCRIKKLPKNRFATISNDSIAVWDHAGNNLNKLRITDGEPQFTFIEPFNENLIAIPLKNALWLWNFELDKDNLFKIVDEHIQFTLLPGKIATFLGNKIKIWDYQGNLIKEILDTTEDRKYSRVIATDNNLIICADEQNENNQIVQVWDYETGESKLKLEKQQFLGTLDFGFAVRASCNDRFVIDVYNEKGDNLGKDILRKADTHGIFSEQPIDEIIHMNGDFYAFIFRNRSGEISQFAVIEWNCKVFKCFF